MKEKTLRKKIRRLEERLQKGPAKLAKLRRDLRALEARKKVTARARETERAGRPARKTAGKKSQARSAPKPVAKQAARKQQPPPKPKRKLNLSPERRAQLAETMRARWAAKRAADSGSPQQPTNHSEPSTDGAPPAEPQ